MTNMIKGAALMLAAICLVLALVGFGRHFEVTDPLAWRSRTQQMRQLDRIEGKVNIILHEVSKVDAQ